MTPSSLFLRGKLLAMYREWLGPGIKHRITLVSQSHDGQCALFLWALDFLIPGLWCVCNCGRSGGPSIPSHAPQESTKGAKQSLAYRASFQVLLANLQGPPVSSSALDPEQPSSTLQVKPKKQGGRAYHKDLYIADGGVHPGTP